jgi:hypothetical protein
MPDSDVAVEIARLPPTFTSLHWTISWAVTAAGKILTRCRIGAPSFVEEVVGVHRGHPGKEET